MNLILRLGGRLDNRGWDGSISADLLDHNVDLISVLHVEVLGGLSFVQAFSVEEEADVGGVELNQVSITL
jgi:hypothetical protein